MPRTSSSQSSLLATLHTLDYWENVCLVYLKTDNDDDDDDYDDDKDDDDDDRYHGNDHDYELLTLAPKN